MLVVSFLCASVFYTIKFDEANVQNVVNIKNFYGLKSKMATNEFVLLSKSGEVASWKKEYFRNIKEKEAAIIALLSNAVENRWKQRSSQTTSQHV